MSRTELNGSYKDGRFLLSDEKKEIHMAIEESQVFSIGNSMGGYYPKKISYKGKPFLAAVRISNSEKYLSREELSHLVKDREGEILFSKRGLWATSSGSALRGLFHSIKEETNPIKAAIHDFSNAPWTTYHEVDTLENMVVLAGGNLCSHSIREGNYSFRYYTDAETTKKEDGSYVENHMNQFHIGCMDSPMSVILGKGGTYLIQTYQSLNMGGSYSHSLMSVYVTPDVNRDKVAALIRELFPK